MEYDCNHWPIWYDFISVDNNEFVDPRAEVQMENWMASIGDLPSKYYQTPREV